jgi:acetoin utilization deacetylase AcuC-like enzyme
MKVIYSPQYFAPLGGHVFPMEKYRLIYEKLLKEGIITQSDVLSPPEASLEDIALVHTWSYISKLQQGKLSPLEEALLELPFSPQLFKASLLSAGGTILAAKIALKEGLGINIGGGFHHAFPEGGRGFCVFHDVAIGIRKLEQEKKVKKVLVVDCDLHQGDGTAYIFRKEANIVTFSIHEEANYPYPKQKSTYDLGLPTGVGDKEYLDALQEQLSLILEKFTPEIVFYLAGADPYIHDQLGGLNLTLTGLKQRDEIVFKNVKDFPLVITLAGGYAVKLEDTVTIHFNTLKEAIIRKGKLKEC